VDWSLAPALESETFTSSTTYDALNRPVALTTPHNDTTPPSVIRPTYNEASLLEQVNVNLRGADTATTFVTNIDYDAKGQRQSIAYANHTTTEYEYDKDTFRLMHLKTNRIGFPSNEQVVQDLSYTYDPVGNITHIQDDADIQNVVYFRNQRVEPSADYEYDAIYRLISASGREHLGQTANNQLNPPRQTDHDDSFRMNLPHSGDGNAMGNYTERYEYDPVGNIQQMIHQAASGGWRRSYTYSEPSLVQPEFWNNRLTSTTVGRSDNPNAIVEPYAYDEHGNMTSMLHLQVLEWDFKDQLHATQQQVVNDGPGEKTYYVYDAAGQRVRKITETANSVKMQERMYLGGFEIYREYGGGATTLERETLHIMDDKRRIALVETKTIDVSPVSNQKPLIRYQFDNHLGSASLELDEKGAVISYEEYYPYGSTSYQAGQNSVEVSLKRHRYTGRERDEETGLYYHGTRYYAPWLARWTAADPSGLVDGPNLYGYVSNRPVTTRDPSGTQGIPILGLSNEVIESSDKDADAKRMAEYSRNLTHESAAWEREERRHGRITTEENQHLAVRLIGMGESYRTGGTGAVLGQILANYFIHDIKPNRGDVRAFGDTLSGDGRKNLIPRKVAPRSIVSQKQVTGLPQSVAAAGAPPTPVAPSPTAAVSSPATTTPGKGQLLPGKRLPLVNAHEILTKRPSDVLQGATESIAGKFDADPSRMNSFLTPPELKAFENANASAASGLYRFNFGKSVERALAEEGIRTGLLEHIGNKHGGKGGPDFKLLGPLATEPGKSFADSTTFASKAAHERRWYGKETIFSTYVRKTEVQFIF
jgi:RHS repeat-associated protein